MSFEVVNWDALLKQVEEMGRNVNRAENAAIKAGANIAVPIMKQEVPRSNISATDYKHMVDDIRVGRVKNVDGVKIVEVGPTDGKDGTRWRANFLVNGTKFMPPNDFILRTAQRTKGQIRAAMLTELQKKVMRWS
ncbi:HK97-gp10 family putative phage morphogenesis protein [Shouchella patagoniensis]|uniref:HK97-gp10 family putative phage morphogenesis protein n=1 Tax=Shouchella patagoniensis TaxID=228576 RepID=UPI0009953F46|nr:HK97-gp10 family putative phage morphogenesis protein [Shouchella patagoniensis]